MASAESKPFVTWLPAKSPPCLARQFAACSAISTSAALNAVASLEDLRSVRPEPARWRWLRGCTICGAASHLRLCEQLLRALGILSEILCVGMLVGGQPSRLLTWRIDSTNGRSKLFDRHYWVDPSHLASQLCVACIHGWLARSSSPLLTVSRPRATETASAGASQK